MAGPVATQTAQVVAVDTHVVLVPTPGGPVPTPLPHPFGGTIQGATVPTVHVGGLPVAVQGSRVVNAPPHLPTPPGASFQAPPTNQGEVRTASLTVYAGGRGVARIGDAVTTCNDPTDLPAGTIVAPFSTVSAG
jgi:uncharacterized Zn-binding protein involved in type VI secretion